eukprot:gene4974-biopygen94
MDTSCGIDSFGSSSIPVANTLLVTLVHHKLDPVMVVLNFVMKLLVAPSLLQFDLELITEVLVLRGRPIAPLTRHQVSHAQQSPERVATKSHPG